jgi:hypothetical protein
VEMELDLVEPEFDLAEPEFWRFGVEHKYQKMWQLAPKYPRLGTLWILGTSSRLGQFCWWMDRASERAQSGEAR